MYYPVAINCYGLNVVCHSRLLSEPIHVLGSELFFLYFFLCKYGFCSADLVRYFLQFLSQRKKNYGVVKS